MKNNKFAKVSLLILTIALCVGAVLAISINASETTTETKPEIISQNVAYKGDFALLYAVDAATATGPVELFLYDKEPGEGVEPIKVYKKEAFTPADPESNLNTDAFIFETEGVVAAAMTKEFYVQAKDATGALSDVKRYSVAEYLYERLASDASAKQEKLYNSVITFGKNAQKVIGKETDESKWITNYRYVTVEGGTIGGYSAGVYPIGTELVPDDTSKAWCVITYDAIGDFTVSEFNGKFKVADSVKNKLTTKVINYPENVETMNTWTLTEPEKLYTNALTANGKFASGNGSPIIQQIKSGDHGVVAKFDISQAGGAAKIFRTDETVDAADATAFECSFDIKMSVPGSKDSEPVEIFVYNSNGGSRFRTSLYGRIDGHSDYLYMNHPSNSTKDKKTFETVDPTDWIHVRFVLYANDLTKAYVYIDDIAEPFISTYNNGAVDFAGGLTFGIRQYTAGYYSKEVTVKDEEGNVVKDENGADVKETVWYGNSDDEVYVLFDNYYCGYTMEANPFTAAN